MNRAAESEREQSEVTHQTLLDRLVDRVQGREWLDIEFKAAKRAIPKDIWPTVSAFANTTGGWVILGASNEGELIGGGRPRTDGKGV